MKKKKIIRNVVACVVTFVILFLVGCYSGLIDLNIKSKDSDSQEFDINILIRELNVQNYQYHKNEKNVEDFFFEELGCIGFEHVGYTDQEFEVDGLSGDTYGVYTVNTEDGVWHNYLIPEKDGASLPCVYEYNFDVNLTLIWSGEW